jgi:ligand-binding sensor domain-containing protein
MFCERGKPSNVKGAWQSAFYRPCPRSIDGSSSAGIDPQLAAMPPGKQHANSVARAWDVKKSRPVPFCCGRFFSVVNPSKSFYSITQIAPALWISLLIVFCCAPTFALDKDRSILQFQHTAWSVNDGAPSEISALAQTEDGYLWIGSPQGLFRFDGVKFEEYKPQPGVELPSHGIYSLMATPDGGLWIAFARTGLGFLRDGSLTVFTRPEELPDSQIHNFARDHDGRIWASTETGLVLREGTRWIPIGHDWNFAPEVLSDLFVDREGNNWV